MDIHDLYDDVTSGGEGEYVLEHRGGEFTFSVRALKRTRKNELLASLPDGFLSPAGLPDEIDAEDVNDLSDDKLLQKIEDAGGDVSELVSDRVLDSHATETVIDCMVDAFSHPKLSDSELEHMLTSSQFPDQEFMAMLNKMIEVSSPDESVRDFRGDS
jgi:hypothetical protein